MQDEQKDLSTNKVNRRKFLKMSAIAGAGMAVTGLVGCGTSKTAETPAPPVTETVTTGTALTGVAQIEAAYSAMPKIKYTVPPSNGKKLRVGIAMQPLIYYWQRYQAAFVLRLEELGAEPVVVWTGPAFNEALVGVESLIQKEVDVINLGGANKETFSPKVPELDKLGIKYVGFQSDTPGVPMVNFATQYSAAAATYYMIERIGGKGNIIVFHTEGLHFTTDQGNVVMNNILKNYPDIKVLESLPVRFPDAEKAGLEDTENLLRKYKKGDIQALFSIYDGPITGGIRAVKDAGLADSVIALTGAIDDPVNEAMLGDQPVWAFAPAFDSWEMGRRTADFAVMAGRGETPPLFSWGYPIGIDRSNAAAYWKVVQEQNKITEATLKKYGKQ